MEEIFDHIQFNTSGGSDLVIHFTGRWCRSEVLPEFETVIHHFTDSSQTKTIRFDSSKLSEWDSTLLVFLTKVITECDKKGFVLDKTRLPEGVQRLLELSCAVPEKKGTRTEKMRIGFFAHVGEETRLFFRSAMEICTFLGDAVMAVMRFCAGRARYRQVDLATTIQECGIYALPIVSMISLLVGLILAFVGAIQLRMFGAEIYVADLVGIAMVRVMGSVMTGIIMAGRTGAAFAAQIGTMEANEEIDAFQTLGVSPFEFLVLPRMLGLTLMMPLLCLYADFMGVLGGLVVGVGMLDLGLIQYLVETQKAVSLVDMSIGLFQGTVFGILIALTGCLRGMQCKRSAAAVGDASTSAVVTGIVSIVVTTALVTVICNVIGV